MGDLSKYTDYKTVLCVNVLIFAEGKVLLVKRPTNKIVNPGKYCGIGGKVEPKESFFQAAKRELREEVGFEIENLKPYGITQTIDPQTGAEWVHVNFVAKLPKVKKMKPSEEGEFHWIDPTDVDQQDMVFDLKEYIKILAKNDQVHLLGQFIFNGQGQLIRKYIQIFQPICV